MKKYLSTIALVLVLAVAFTGCAGNKSREYDLAKLSDELMESDAFSDILSAVDLEIGVMVYGLDADDIEDYSLYLSTRATTEEIGMFKCRDAEAAARLLERVQARAQAQKELYESYAPDEPPKLENGYIKADGVYVFYIIAANAETVVNIME